MCGIAGIARRDGPPPSMQSLLRMAAALHHRGPDGHGLFTGRRVGLAHTRLAIIDLAGGAQPLTNEDGSVMVVYNGEVYDHINYRARGGVWRYAMGKNMWKFDFNRGHDFQARDNYGNPYQEQWDEINVLPGTNPWWRDNVSTEGTVLFEPAAFKLYELAGAPSPSTNYFNFRVIDGVAGVSNMGGISSQTGKRSGEAGAIVWGGVRDVSEMPVSPSVKCTCWESTVWPALTNTSTPAAFGLCAMRNGFRKPDA